MLSSAKSRAEATIVNRRKQESAVNNLNSKLRQEFSEKQYADWANKGSKLHMTKNVMNRAEQLRLQYRMNIESRKEKLAHLLESENAALKEEIRGLIETPEQVRQRMMNRVEELKQRREGGRKEFVDKMMDRKFKDNADELRKVNSELEELRVGIDRDKQMEEKQEIMVEKWKEDMIFAEIAKKQSELQRLKEIREAEFKKAKVEQKNSILGIQKEMQEARRIEEEAQLEYEKEMLKQAWKEEAEASKKRALEIQARNAERNKEIFSMNKVQKMKKEEEISKEKETDKEWIKSIIAKEERQDLVEKELKEKAKEETRNFLLNFKNRSNELTEYEVELERLINEEAEKQWALRQAQWKKETDARIKLMYEVYDNRAQEIYKKRSMMSEEEKAKEKEKETLISDIEDYQAELERRRLEELAKNKAHQDFIMRQIKEKEEKSQTERNKDLEDEISKLREHAAYIKQIEDEKKKGLALLMQLKKKK